MSEAAWLWISAALATAPPSVLLCTHRETAGVLVRVEVGPKEAQSGTAVVALANEPGTVAAKETVNVDLQLMKEIRVKLEQVG